MKSYSRPLKPPAFDLASFAAPTANAAYVLGFLAADGCVRKNRVTIVLKSSDQGALRNLQILTQHKGKIFDAKQFDKRTLKTYYRHGLSFNSKAFVELLEQEYAMGPRKSLTLAFPDLPDRVQLHFLRGYFDGDGCVTQTRTRGLAVNFCGTKPFLERTREILCKAIGMQRGSICQKGKIHSLDFRGSVAAEKVLTALYVDSSTESRLGRKYDTFMLNKRHV